jgi:hypothetical protein
MTALPLDKGENGMSKSIRQVRDHRHCEEQERRSNPALLVFNWIASLTLAMTLEFHETKRRAQWRAFCHFS